MKKITVFWANGKSNVWTVLDSQVANVMQTFINTKFVNVKLVKIADVEVPVLDQETMEAMGAKD